MRANFLERPALHVAGPIIRGLLARSVDVLSAREDGYAGRSAPEILDRATSLGRVLHSEDEDLLREADLRLRAGYEFAGVTYARQTALSIGGRIHDLEVIAIAGDPSDYVNQVVYLPL